MAVLRQQQGFVQELFEAGMVDEVGVASVINSGAFKSFAHPIASFTLLVC